MKKASPIKIIPSEDLHKYQDEFETLGGENQLISVMINTKNGKSLWHDGKTYVFTELPFDES